MNTILPFDELNLLEATLPSRFDENGRFRSRQDFDDTVDEMFELFLLAYANGVEATNEDLSTDYRPDLNEVMETVDRRVAGQTWRERMEDYYENGGTVADVVRIMETESHRDSNEAAYRTARQAGATTKTWRTVGDSRVRDTHFYLDGVSAPIDGEFYSFRGGSTQFPGQWGIAEEDVNCRCWLTFS